MIYVVIVNAKPTACRRHYRRFGWAVWIIVNIFLFSFHNKWPLFVLIQNLKIIMILFIHWNVMPKINNSEWLRYMDESSTWVTQFD